MTPAFRATPVFARSSMILCAVLPAALPTRKFPVISPLAVRSRSRRRGTRLTTDSTTADRAVEGARACRGECDQKFGGSRSPASVLVTRFRGPGLLVLKCRLGFGQDRVRLPSRHDVTRQENYLALGQTLRMVPVSPTLEPLLASELQLEVSPVLNH